VTRGVLAQHGRPLTIVDPSLVLMVGPAGSGKSTLAEDLFDTTEILSSDVLRKVVSGDESDQSASGSAFAILHRMLRHRLADRRFTVVDATNLRPAHRRPLLRAAAMTGTSTVAIVLDLPHELIVARDAARGRSVGEAVIERQSTWLRETVDGDALSREGIATVIVLRSPDVVDRLTIERIQATRH
jgi:protein phosphatase